MRNPYVEHYDLRNELIRNTLTMHIDKRGEQTI